MPVTSTHRSIVIVGGGSAGITVAARLQHKGFDDVGLIDPATMHYYQPLWTLVGGGRAPVAESGRREEDLIPSKVSWIKDAAATNERVVTKYMSEINFVSSALQGDLIEMGLRATHFGRTSLTMRARVRNMITRNSILTVDRLVFVNIGSDGKPAPHGYTDITFSRDRVPPR